jgi:hypothetical protein
MYCVQGITWEKRLVVLSAERYYFCDIEIEKFMYVCSRVWREPELDYSNTAPCIFYTYTQTTHKLDDIPSLLLKLLSFMTHLTPLFSPVSFAK